ncbi:hypothetical protein [Moraxella catarrhalis]|uniref:Uncharacterized protein n=1 Tax=Moraxella catarrhalis TaxID=480 RepID=A0A198UG56_MORCA|nr:hypothetical protein [Moraxella catarrhalis]OAU95413.1 hypothetical protein AO384_1604 [Moraxella catarrhalis]OAU98206.1 hypothetical protein AO383_0662 [Moraxella catarrhalis]OAV02782.1 hypothetical protein AO385_0852 [Moraxella catarrhalis]
MLPTRLIQNRHILTKLDITMWAPRHADVMTLPSWSGASMEGADVKDSDLPMSSMQPPAHQSLSPKSEVPIPPIIQSLDPQPKIAPTLVGRSPKQVNDTLLKTQQAKTSHLKSPPQHEVLEINQSSFAAKSIEYHLKVMIYRHWIIMADVDALDTAGRELWLSLHQSLTRQAKQHHLALISRQFDYPLFEDDPESDSVSLANVSLRGFIFGCMRESDQVKYLAPLTTLPDYLNLESIQNLTLISDHHISQMLLDGTAKKAFWQALHR